MAADESGDVSSTLPPEEKSRLLIMGVVISTNIFGTQNIAPLTNLGSSGHNNQFV